MLDFGNALYRMWNELRFYLDGEKAKVLKETGGPKFNVESFLQIKLRDMLAADDDFMKRLAEEELYVRVVDVDTVLRYRDAFNERFDGILGAWPEGAGEIREPEQHLMWNCHIDAVPDPPWLMYSSTYPVVDGSPDYMKRCAYSVSRGLHKNVWDLDEERAYKYAEYLRQLGAVFAKMKAFVNGDPLPCEQDEAEEAAPVKRSARTNPYILAKPEALSKMWAEWSEAFPAIGIDEEKFEQFDAYVGELSRISAKIRDL